MRFLACSAGLIVCTMAVTAGSAAPRSALHRQDSSVGALVARCAEYIAAYQQAFAFLVADERYVQLAVRVDRGARGGRSDEPRPIRRVMRGELFLTYLAADRRWVALHDVAEVDGTPVAAREDLRALLAVSPVQSVAGRLFRHNARYNIGSIARNFNEPTLALQVLDPLHRASFDFRVQDAGRPFPPRVVTLTFRERGRPTLVRSLDGRAVFSSGEIDIEAASGTVTRTRIAFRHEAIDAELITTYAHDARLDLWLPTVFTERYTTGARDCRPAEVITADARYENYRRFEGRGRVVTDDR